MTIARQQTNWAAHLYVYLALFALGLATLWLALTGTERRKPGSENGSDEGSRTSR
jgi:hypothetical protein